MKKLLVTAMAVVLTLSLVIGSSVIMAGNGNNAPTGKHYNLNIIGVPNQKNTNFDGGNGSRIFILRTGTTSFYVNGGNSYQVLDHDGTDGTVGTGIGDPGIIFPWNFSSGKWQVDIWVRLVGPMDTNNKLDIETAYWDGFAWVHWATINLTKNSKFQMKGRELLADGYENMLWEMEPGTKFRICQMRIYLVQR